MCLLCVHSAVGCDPSALWYTMPNAENAMIHTFGTHSRSLLWWPCMARFSCVFLLLVWMRHGHYHFAARLPSTCTIAQNPTLTLTKCVSHGNIFFFLFILLCLVPLRCFDRASYGPSNSWYTVFRFCTFVENTTSLAALLISILFFFSVVPSLALTLFSRPEPLPSAVTVVQLISISFFQIHSH